MTSTALVTKSDRFTNVIFYGDNTSKINNDWTKEKHKITEDYSDKEKSIEEKIALCKVKLSEINKSKPWWKFWCSKNEKKEINELESDISVLELEKRALPKRKNNDIYTRLGGFLIKKGYTLTDMSVGFYDNSEIWIKYD